MADRAGGRRGRAAIPEPEQSFQEDAPRPKGAEELEAQGSAEHEALFNGDRAKKIRLEAEASAIAEWIVLQNKEDALIEKWIAPIRRKKAKIKADLKSEYDIPTEAFNARANLRRIELMADNDEVVIAVNELFEAVQVGESVDLEAALARVTAKKAEEAKEAEAKKNKVTQRAEATL